MNNVFDFIAKLAEYARFDTAGEFLIQHAKPKAFERSLYIITTKNDRDVVRIFPDYKPVQPVQQTESKFQQYDRFGHRINPDLSRPTGHYGDETWNE